MKEFLKPDRWKVIITAVLTMYYVPNMPYFFLPTEYIVRSLNPVIRYLFLDRDTGFGVAILLAIFLGAILFYLIACIGLFVLRKMKKNSHKKTYGYRRDVLYPHNGMINPL